MKFLSLASGIEAASVAFKPLGWKAIGFSEIDPFASAVLAYHHPEVPNFGDMTRFIEWPEEAFAEADIVVGGPPCQAFSVAGMRAGLNDARGNLTLTYAELINHADDVRTRRGRPPVLALYENVPGILSDRTNAFGCLLAALAGEDEPIVVKKWPRAGVVDGRRRRVAWVTLDAQYFGVAQRRRRVFVLAVPREFVERLGERADPAEILSIGRCLRRDTPSRESEGKESPAQSAISVALRGREGGGTAELGDEVQNCLRASSGGGDKPHVLCLAHGQGGAEVASERSPTLTCNHEAPIAVHGTQDPCVSTNTAFALGRNNGGENVLAFDTTQITSAENRSNPRPGDPCHPLAAGAHPPTVVFSCKDYGGDVTEEVAPTLRAMNHAGSHANAGGQVAVAFAQNSRDEVRLMGGDGQIVGALADEPWMKQTCYAEQHAESETLYNKGFNTLKEGNASTQETYPGTLLRTLRQEVGEEAFAKWGLGILDSLQQAEVLRQALHGLSIRPASFSRSWVVCCALSRSENSAGWLLQSLREAGSERCSSQGWEPSEQLAGELGAYLSELSRPGAQAARFVRDLWFASEGVGLLQQALLAVQEVGRPAGRQGQSVLRGSEGRGSEESEVVPSAGMQCEVSRERLLHEACTAGEARDSRKGTTEQERSGKGWVGETPFAVRRLTVEECEFLQGFPRGYTKIPWRKKPASECPDGPRYRALGNSWAIPVVRWIGQRIDSVLSRGQTRPSHVEAAQKRSTPESGEQRRDRTGS